MKKQTFERKRLDFLNLKKESSSNAGDDCTESMFVPPENLRFAKRVKRARRIDAYLVVVEHSHL